MEVVAEGAETDSDAVELYQLGCEYAQGFAFGEPMSAEHARALLQADGMREQSAGAARKRGSVQQTANH
jgi:EAL domain-containing protein (putative c-di-GMP-specific phosphodiesterase class I)